MLDAVAQVGDLAVHAGAAVDGGHPAVDGLGQRLEHLGDLEGELAGGHEDEAAGPLRLGPADAGEQREAEGERLARAGLGLAAHVAAGEAVGDGEGLDGEGGGDAGARSRAATRAGGRPRSAKDTAMGSVGRHQWDRSEVRDLRSRSVA